MSSHPVRSRLMRLVVPGPVVLLGLWWLWPSSQSSLESLPTAVVERGPLVIQVIESGTIKPQEQLVISNEVPGQTTIISLVAEGTRVQAGDLLVELDASELKDKHVDQSIRVQNDEASVIRAREGLAVAQSQAQSDIARAELDQRFAQEDLVKYREGEYPNQLRKAQSDIALAREELQRADEKQLWSSRLLEENYLSASELQADQLAAKRAALNLEMAENALHLLEQYTYPRQLAQLESNITQTSMALERVRRKASADITQSEADLRARESEQRRQLTRLADIESQLSKTRIVASRSGQVVYATSVQNNRRGGSEPLAAGQSVRERQELIYLPTDQGMRAEVSIHEAQLALVQVGMRARVSVDAVAGSSYLGTVTSIAPLPDASQMWMNPDLKVYLTQVRLEGNDPALRTGMSCRVEIVAEQYEDALFVPVQAVVRIGPSALAYVVKADGSQELRQLDIGHDNGRVLHIRKGLEAGERVLLTPPLQAPPGFEPPKPPPLPAAETTPAATVSSPPAEGESREERRARWANMTPEQRAAARAQHGGGEGRPPREGGTGGEGARP